MVHQDESGAQGMAAERKFQRLCKHHNLRCERATRQQDRREHWDFRVWMKSPTDTKKQRYRIEVKSAKKQRRSDRSVQYTYQYLEAQGVPMANGGANPGWLRGNADFIAFEVEKGFLFVDRRDALKYLEEIIAKDTLPPLTSRDQPALNRAYTRTHRGALRGDIVYLVEISKLQALEGSFVIHSSELEADSSLKAK